MVTIAAKQAAQQITLVKLASICGDTPSRDQLVRDLRRTARAGLTHSSAREDSVRKIWDEVFTLAEEIASVR